MKRLAFALRAVRRDGRVREMRVLAAAVAIAVGALTAVAFFTDRVDGAMERRATALLGADLVIETEDAIRPAWSDAAAERGLRQARFVTFPNVLVVGEQTELASVKAVSPAYPLRGELRVAASAYGEAEVRTRGPERGGVWLDPRLLTRLDLAVGDTVPVGATELEITGALQHEPDRGGSLFQLAPRLMMHQADLEATGLITQGSRVDRHFLVAGDAQAVAGFRQWAQGELGPNAEIRGIDNARPEMRRALERANGFLGLAAILAVILAGAGVAVASHSLADREADTSALLRCLGASQRLVVATLLLRLAVVALIASAVGTGLGWLAQAGLVAIVGDWFGQDLPLPGPWPALTGLATGLITLIGFGLVPALRVRRVPVMRVLRREQGAPEPSVAALLGLAVAAIAALVWYQAGDAELAGWVIAGTLGILAALGLGGWGLIRLVGRFRGQAVTGWRFGLANLARRPRASTVQLVGFGMGILALLLLTVVRVDILAAWERDVPPKAPNQFLVNIQPGEVDPIRDRLAAIGAETAGFYPVVRGRLVAIDGESVEPGDYEAGRGRRLLERQFNLTWAEAHRPENEVVAGEWWRAEEAAGEPQLSVEQGVAETFGIAVGDTLTFRVADEEITAPVTNLRRVDWQSFKANFFVIATPEALSDAPATWITSYWAPPDSGAAITELVRDFPGVTVLDIEEIIEQVRGIIDQGTRAVEYVFGFTLLAGLVVLVAAVHATRDERRVEIALLRTLGASRARVRVILAAEFGALGVLAGTVAAAGAAATGWAVTTEVMELPYTFNPMVFVWGIVGGGVGILAAGLLATRHLLAERPLAVLRHT